MNPVQKLMITGAPEMGCLEQISGYFLWLPAEMWGESNLKIVVNNNLEDVSVSGNGRLGRFFCKPIKMLCCVDDKGPKPVGCLAEICWCVACLAVPVVYALTSLACTPCLCCGLSCKVIALLTDEDVAKFNKLAVDYLTNEVIFLDVSEKDNLAIEIAKQQGLLDSNNIKVNNILQSGNTGNHLQIVFPDELQQEIAESVYIESRDLEKQVGDLNDISSNLKAQIEQMQTELDLMQVNQSLKNNAKQTFLEEYKKLKRLEL